MSKGKLIVISGASGVGKGTVLGIMMKKRKDLSFSVSATTRPPRPRRRRSSSSMEGGMMKISTASGSLSRTCFAPAGSMSSRTGPCSRFSSA